MRPRALPTAPWAFLALLSPLLGCAPDALLFGTSTRFALEVGGAEEARPSVSLGYERFEGVSAPVRKDGKLAPDAFSTYSAYRYDSGALLKVWEPVIVEQRFATGLAAENAVRTGAAVTIVDPEAEVVGCIPVEGSAGPLTAMQELFRAHEGVKVREPVLEMLARRLGRPVPDADRAISLMETRRCTESDVALLRDLVVEARSILEEPSS